MFFNNRGMLLEDLINRTIDYYIFNKIAFFEKRNLPIKITSIDVNGQIIGKLMGKTTTDYVGIYKGKYFDFEAKQTNNDNFLLNNIKSHQLQHLNFVNYCKGISFIILYFCHYDIFFIIFTSQINHLIKNNIKSVNLKDCYDKYIKLSIKTPGIIDFLAELNKK